MDLTPGYLLHNRYKIIRLLGQGGMGAVYLANDQSLANEVAVKINRSDNPKAAAQFFAEARLLATLRHPNLPRVIDYFQEEGMGQFLVMDFIAGQDLRNLLEENAVPPLEQLLTWAVQLGAALSYLHRQYPPIFHRDVKPANLKLTSQNEIVLVDFGIAKAAASSADTSTGAAALSPGYAPPEQYGVGHTGAYSDQYAMGATFYQLLTGHLPADAFQRLMGKATLTPVQALNPSVPLHVDQALQRAMALRVEDRFPSVDDFVQALTHPSANVSPQPTSQAGAYPPTLASGFPSAAQSGYPTPSQPPYPPTLAQPGYPTPAQPNFPPSQPPYPQAQPGYPTPAQPNFPPSQPPYPQAQPGYPTQAQANIPPSQPPYPQAQPGYPPTMAAGYPQQPQVGQPAYPQGPNTVGGYAPPPAVAAPAKRFPWLWVGIIGAVLVLGCGVIFALAMNNPLFSPEATPTLRPTATREILATLTRVASATPNVSVSSPTTATATAGTTATATVKAPSPSAPAATATTLATAPPVGGTLPNPAAFMVKYLTFFQDHTFGFNDSDWDVTLSAGAKVTAKDGILNVQGGVEAISTKTNFSNDIRVFLGGGSYGIGLKDFTLFVQRSSDGASFLRMTCSDQTKNGNLVLSCEWYQQIGGKETRLANTSGDLCSGVCDIEVELDSGTFRVYANRQMKITFKNTQLNSGAIGLRINNPTQTPYTLDKISVYKIPTTSSLGSYMLLDDFGEVWPQGHTDNEFATIDRTISVEAYDWILTSKQDVFTRVNPTPDFVLSDRFVMYVDVQQLSGPTSACYGALFHYQDNNNYYYFCASDNGTISVSAKKDGTWVTLLDAVKAPSILPGELNTLMVKADGNQYSFSVNDTLVKTITDDRFKGGSIGLAGELYAAGQNVEWEYTQVQVNQLP